MYSSALINLLTILNTMTTHWWYFDIVKNLLQDRELIQESNNTLIICTFAGGFCLCLAVRNG